MSTIEELTMAKAVVSFGYTNYVLDLKDAVAVGEMLSKAELYEEKYVQGSDNTFHIYASDKQAIGNIKLISDDLYRMAKLAGPPPTKT
jgi:sporulation protein YlmC with PRC-barrel domain